MQAKLVNLLKGAQRVPSLLVLNPKQSLQELNLQQYEVLDCEPLHDLKGHGQNLLNELPHILPTHSINIERRIKWSAYACRTHQSLLEVGETS